MFLTRKNTLNAVTLSALAGFTLSAALSPERVQAASFTDVTDSAGLGGMYAHGAGWGDLNNDGCPDLAISGTDAVVLMKNECDGNFTDITISAGLDGLDGLSSRSWATVWADVNADGDLDLYLSKAGLYLNNGDETFSFATGSGIEANSDIAGASFADYDMDGDLDLFLAVRFDVDQTGSLKLDMLLNNDNGVFTDVAEMAGILPLVEEQQLTFMGAFLDYDLDGDLDLYRAVDFGPDVLHKNLGDGTFMDATAEAGLNPNVANPGHGMGIAVGDINNDGCMDIASSNNGGTGTDGTDGAPDSDELDDHGPTILYLNQCDGTFEVASYATGIKDRGFVEWGLNFVDYDNDGDLDFPIVAGGMLTTDGQANALYENDGSGNLVEITDKAGSLDGPDGASFGSYWADYDNDGDLDWFVTNASEDASANQLFRNDSATGNYLAVDLICSDGNIDCIGATVSITAGSRTQIRTLQAGVSYVGSEEIKAYFGTGVKNTVEILTIQWPNGSVMELTDVAVNQTLVVDQETGPQEPQLATITGTVTDADGMPVEDAGVFLRPAADGSEIVKPVSVTDANGNYGYSDVAPGAWRLSALLSGQLYSGVTPFTVEAGQTEIEIDLVLDKVINN